MDSCPIQGLEKGNGSRELDGEMGFGGLLLGTITALIEAEICPRKSPKTLPKAEDEMARLTGGKRRTPRLLLLWDSGKATLQHVCSCIQSADSYAVSMGMTSPPSAPRPT